MSRQHSNWSLCRTLMMTFLILSTEVTSATICNFVSLKIISFVFVLSSTYKLLRNVVFSDLLIAIEQEDNLQGNETTNSGKSHPQLAVWVLSP